jgi:TP901 family phage tail tape measure protein
MTPAAILNILVRANTSQATASLLKTDSQLKRTAASGHKASMAMSRVGAQATRAAKGVALAGAAAGAASVKLAVDFDKGMRNVNSIAQLNEKQFQSLEKRVLRLAGPTAQAPKTLAAGLYDLVSSGFDANESMFILEKSAYAATAGLTTTEISTKAVAAVLNAYRMPAKNAGKVSDVLFRTVDRGVISFEELASTVGDVLPFASSLDVSLREVGAATATMTKAGINAPETMTRIKNVMVTLLKPGEGLRKAIKELGVESGEALIKQKGFQGSLEALIGTTDGSKKAVAKLFPNIRALGGALALTGGNSKAAAADLKGMQEASGATSRALSQQSKSVALQWQRLKAQASVLGIQFGSKLLPEISALVKILSNPKLDAEEKFERITDAVIDLASRGFEKAVDVAAEAGPKIASAVAGGFVRAWSEMNPFAKLLTAAAIIRVVGGKGALTATGATIGQYIGAGVGGGMAAGAATGIASGLAGGAAAGTAGGAFTKFGQKFEKNAAGILVPAGTAAGAAGGAAAGSKFLPALTGKLSPLVKRAGMVGVGIALADQVLKGLGDRVTEGSDELRSRLEGMADRGLMERFFTDPVFESPFGDSKESGAAKPLLAAMDQLARKRTILSKAEIADLAAKARGLDLTKQQRAQVARTIDLLRVGSNLKIGVDLDMDPAKLQKLDAGIHFLRSGWAASMGDITKVTRRNMAIIRNTIGMNTTQGRKAAANNYRAMATAIKLQMDRSGNHTKAGWDRIRNLTRKADLVNPTKAKAAAFGREWALGMDRSQEITRKGFREMLREARKMPAPMRKVALDTWLAQIKEARRSKDITKGEFRKMRSNALAEFSGLEIGSKRKSKRGADGVIGNIARMVNESGKGLGVLVSNANSALSAFGVKELNYKVKKWGGGEQKKQQGGFIVPGASSGDKFQTAVPNGSFVMNREATKAFGFQKGGMARVALEAGERVFMPDEVKRVGHKALHAANKAVPRFQSGGIVGIPWAPGEEVAASILPLLTRLHDKFGFTVTDAFDRDRSAGHKSPGHNITGTAVDAAGGNLAGLVRWAVSKGLTTYWNGGAGATPLAGHDTHAHIEFGGAGALLGAAMEKLARITLDGPAGPLRDMGQGALDKVRQAGDRMLAKNAMMTGAGDPFSFGAFAGGDGSWTQVMAQIAKARGWSLPAWRELVNRESGGDPRAVNPTAGAAGLAQALPPSKYPPGAWPYTGPESAVKQIQWMADYMAGRYGSPTSALAFHDANNWYQKGGLVQALAKGGPVGEKFRSVGGQQDFLKRIWGEAAPQFGMDPKSPLPFSKVRHGEAKWMFAPGYVENAGQEGKGKGELWWPDWLWAKDGNNMKRNQLAQLAFHEIAHRFQNPKATASAWEAEGGAEAFAREMMGRTGRKVAGSGAYGPDARKARKHHGLDWVMSGQFGKAVEAVTLAKGPLAMSATSPKAKASGRDTPFERSLDKAMGTARKAPTRKNRRKQRKALKRALKIISGLGLDGKQKELKRLSDAADKYGEYAGNAQGLSTEDADGNPIAGLFGGKDEGHWLNAQLGALMNLRNRLIEAEAHIQAEKPKAAKLLDEAKARLRKVQAALEAGRKRKHRLEKNLDTLEKQLERLRKKPKVNKAAIDATKGKIKNVKGNLGELDTKQKERGRVRDLLGGENGVVNRIENRRKALNTIHGNILGDGGDGGWKGLKVVQGIDGPGEKMASLPAIGILGGEILTAQQSLADFGRKPDVSADTTDTGTDDSERAGLLEQLLREANQRAAVANSQFAVIRDFDLPGFAGMFAKGGRLKAGQWGIAGETGQPEIVSGPARVYNPAESAAMMNGSGETAIRVVIEDRRVIVEQDGREIEAIVDDRTRTLARRPRTPGGSRL